MKVAWILGPHKKPFSDGDVVTKSMSAVAETLLEGKLKEEFCKKKKNQSKILKRTDILAQDLLASTRTSGYSIHKAGCVKL